MARCLEAEGATFVLDTLSVLALMAGLVAWRWNPIAGPAVFIAVAVVGLAAGRFASGWLEGTRFALPAEFWWRPSTLGIVAVEASCWLAHGLRSGCWCAVCREESGRSRRSSGAPWPRSLAP